MNNLIVFENVSFPVTTSQAFKTTSIVLLSSDRLLAHISIICTVLIYTLVYLSLGVSVFVLLSPTVIGASSLFTV